MKTLSQKQAVFALNVAKLIMFIYERGYSCSLGETFRTANQAAIYAKEGKGIVNSLHCKRLAIDINLFSPDGKYFPDTKDYEPFGTYWELLDDNNRWGGKFPRADGCHFQMSE
jgi:hypothetical protein